MGSVILVQNPSNGKQVKTHTPAQHFMAGHIVYNKAGVLANCAPGQNRFLALWTNAAVERCARENCCMSPAQWPPDSAWFSPIVLQAGL